MLVLIVRHEFHETFYYTYTPAGIVPVIGTEGERHNVKAYRVPSKSMATGFSMTFAWTEPAFSTIFNHSNLAAMRLPTQWSRYCFSYSFGEKKRNGSDHKA